MSLGILTPAVGDLLVHECFVLNHCEVVLSLASWFQVRVAEMVRETGEDEVDLVGIQSIRHGHGVSISAHTIPRWSYIKDSWGGPFTLWSMSGSRLTNCSGLASVHRAGWRMGTTANMDLVE